MRTPPRGAVLTGPVLASIMACAAMQPAQADDSPPPFDRPSFSFAPAVLPVGTFDWEQGLPDMERDSDAGMRTTTYTADTVLRYGMTANLEVQLHASPWNHASIRTGAVRTSAQGAGDTALGIKWAPSLDSKQWTLAVLGLVSFDTGSAAFSAGHTVTSLGVAAARDLGGNRSLGLYANLDHGAGQNTWAGSANFNFPIHGDFGGFAQIGRFADGGVSSSLAGGGITWLIHDTIQLDLDANVGMTKRSPDYQLGFGVSVLFGK
ncbi:MAG: transporter [Proteobacteria bacterium]|nr:transporter [Pseudomonadota bacterium]